MTLTHRRSKTPEHVVWKNMRMRCRNPKNPAYKNYGGRGITIDPAWESFDRFFADMGERPVWGTLERRDNNKGYSKENCYWATSAEQNLNKRIQLNNKTGLKGVSWGFVRQKWKAKAGKTVLYEGINFFEACCARKSWDAKRGGR